MEDEKKVPVTILTGFLGSGKTTLLNHILTATHGKKLAVIENEFGEVGIDDALLKKNTKMQVDEEILEMMNGCICCTVRQDLVEVLKKLSARPVQLDGVLIETTGMADPAPVAQTFFADEFISQAYRLDGIITLVDAKHIEQHLDEEKPEGAENEAVEQLAFADRVLLNKTDLVDPADLDRVEGRIKAINAFAPILRTCQSQISVESVLNIGAFDLKRTLEMDPEFLNTDGEHEHDNTVSSLSIMQEGEVHISLVNDWVGEILKTKGQDIYRMKGVLAISGRENKFVYQAVHMIFDGSFDEEEFWDPQEPRVNKLVFIGKNLDKEELTSAFNACLVTPENQAKIAEIEKVKAEQQRGQMLVQAAHRDDVFALKRLIDAGVDVNYRNVIGQTAMHIACLWGNYTTVGFLLSSGADPNQKNQRGQAPLHSLTQNGRGTAHGRIEAAKKMVEAGADLAALDGEGKMPWEGVADGEERGEELVKILTPKP